MDNASYHSRQLENNPTSSWRKKNIQDWLDLKKINWVEGMVKAELMQLVTLHKPANAKRYAVDEMAAEKYCSSFATVPL